MDPRIERHYYALEHAEAFLRETGTLRTEVIRAAQDLIGHQNPILNSEWEYFENVRRLCCPWVVNRKNAHFDWTPFRDAEAMFGNRSIVLELLGRDIPLELAFGISAISCLEDAGFIESHFADEPRDPMDEYDPARDEAFSGLSMAISVITLGRQLKNMPETKPIPDDKLKEYRRRLNKSAAEKRNEPYRQLHWEFRHYLASNKIKSIRNGAKLFYESLPEERRIYQSVEHAVRNLSESVYGKKS